MNPWTATGGVGPFLKPCFAGCSLDLKKNLGNVVFHCISDYQLIYDISSFADVKLIWDVIPKPYQDPRRTLEQLGVTEVQFIQVDYLADQHLNEQWRALAPPDETHGVTEMGFDTKVVWRFEGHSKTEVL